MHQKTSYRHTALVFGTLFSSDQIDIEMYIRKEKISNKIHQN